MKYKSKAFTLIELLVVIAVIALLMSVVIPVMKKAKEKANSTICTNNLHQYGMAGTLYIQDNNNYFPYAFFWLYTYKSLYSYFPVHPLVCRWHDNIVDPPDGSMWPYLEAKKIHMCPTFRSLVPAFGDKHAGHVNNIPINAQYSYAINGFIAHDKKDPSAFEQRKSLKTSMVKSPSQVFLFSEENLWTIPELSTFCLNDNSIGAGKTPLDCFATYHGANRNGEAGKGGGLDQGKANAVFVDCSTNEVKAEDTLLLSLPDRSTYREWIE